MIVAYITEFMARLDDLDSAKRRYEQAVARAKDTVHVLFASEQAFGVWDPSYEIRDLLGGEITGYGPGISPMTKEEMDQYGIYSYITLVVIPPTSRDDYANELMPLFVLSLDDDWPARFPSRITMIAMSPTGTETPHFESN